MSNETEVKPEEVGAVVAPGDEFGQIDAIKPEAAEPAASEHEIESVKAVEGEVTITVTKNGLGVKAPANLLIALAVLDAGRIYLEMQYADGLRVQKAKAKPMIVRPNGMEGMMKRLSRPS